MDFPSNPSHLLFVPPIRSTCKYNAVTSQGDGESEAPLSHTTPRRDNSCEHSSHRRRARRQAGSNGQAGVRSHCSPVTLSWPSWGRAPFAAHTLSDGPNRIANSFVRSSRTSRPLLYLAADWRGVSMGGHKFLDHESPGCHFSLRETVYPGLGGDSTISLFPTLRPTTQAPNKAKTAALRTICFFSISLCST